MTVKEPVVEGLEARISTIAAQLHDAEEVEQTAQKVRDEIAGLNVLGETSPDDLATAEEALSEAQRHTSAVRSARSLLEARQREQDAAEAAEKVQRLRTESKAAQAKQTTALAQVAQLSAQLSKALATVNAQGAILDGVHAALVAADPITTGEVDADHRAAIAQISTTLAQKQSEIRSAASRVQYQLQNTSGGDPTVEQEIPLLDGGKVASGTRYSAARAQVLEWEVGALLGLEDQEREARADAWDEFAANTEISGLGALPASPTEIRTAAGALDASSVAMLISDDTARSLAGLADYLPKAVWSGVAVREIRPKDAVAARLAEERLADGRKALAVLASPN